MTTDSSEGRTQTCECGNDAYHIKWTVDGDIWAICTECERPTSTVGSGPENQLMWYSEDDEGPPLCEHGTCGEEATHRLEFDKGPAFTCEDHRDHAKRLFPDVEAEPL